MSATLEHVRASVAVAIGERLVGDAPAYIVAEIGVNHDGELRKALDLVDVAADAGADAVKLQIFDADDLVLPGARLAEYQRGGPDDGQHALLKRLQLSFHECEHIRARCESRGVECLATPFGPRDVERLIALRLRAAKIASTDLNNVPLLRRASQTGLPLIVSTGASMADEIAACVERFESWGARERLILLHCVSAYPTPVESANLRAIGALADRFGVPCGFSDHTTSVQTGAWAVAAGASLLEKHLTLDRRANGPDHAMSLEPSEFAAYVREARAAEAALGDGELGFQAIEADVRAAARKSVVSAQPIPRGVAIRPEMLSIKRPAGGVSPDQLDAVVGRKLRIDIGRDTPITWDMLA
ncbi:MAG: N-acetylneuraminate synthase family protein [Phycisphaerae bacterium]